MASPKASEARPSCLVSAKPSRHTGQAQTASATRAAAASAQNTTTHVITKDTAVSLPPPRAAGGPGRARAGAAQPSGRPSKS